MGECSAYSSYRCRLSSCHYIRNMYDVAHQIFHATCLTSNTDNYCVYSSNKAPHGRDASERPNPKQ